MANPWFESVIEARRRAKRRLPSSVYMALVAGSERGSTLRDNIGAFAELGFAPFVTNLPADRDLSTTIMGQEVAFPVMISPTGVQAIHPDGEVAVARAANNRGAAMGLGGFGSKPIEEVIAANPKTFFQTYWTGTKDAMLHRIERARAAGAKGLIVTLDWTFGYGRDWGSPEIPQTMDLKTIVKFAPEIILGGKFAYLMDYAKTLRPPELTVPNMQLPGQPAPGFFQAYGEWMQTPQPTWDDVAWLRREWGGPFMVKGITRVDDAKAAVQTGATAISVSNHGGNNLDGTPGTIRLLPAIADAVGHEVEVLMDGGIRRGSDVAKALALGARAVLIGRAYLWGVGANGQAGVENVLDIMRDGLSAAMLGLGKRSVHDLSPADLLIPPGFARTLGTPEGHLYGAPSLGAQEMHPSH
ncbi:mycofactocin biosynthesis FMN-dependent deaminase MftD [Georgenia sp. TF02-10]|uniref:pre-mycofactocin synthase MftD n=1 Tax=Georgenia sp. TF02-10 TaxID=2917725 RepID=UPI001FA7688B|nr:pre-mycofactocin synthase MftD [Georgenia sp. TF02-10]UNX54222.1 mycofactocin biosynthesis FMN-dependent deaminase MftD [Georgenia sp. TF02-10]